MSNTETTLQTTAPERPDIAPNDAELSEIFQPVFDCIAESAVHRELRRELPFDAVTWLQDVKFGALRVPREFGGYGATWRQFLDLLVDLAAADPNVAHLYRGHIAVVEEKLASADSDLRSLWLQRFGSGDLVGNASTEPGNTPLASKQTLLTRDGDDWFLNGTKHYSTGSIFADWIDVSASLDTGEQVNLLVASQQPGVSRSDDWDGFGQKLTGTGTTVFTNAEVDPTAVLKRSDRLTYLGALYQVVLLAAVAGIAETLSAETAAIVRERKRVYSHGNSDLVRNDPQIKQVVGEIASSAYAARSLVLGTAPSLEAALEEAQLRELSGTDEQAPLEATYRAELDVYRAQVVIADLVPRAATHLFNALSSSAVRVNTAMDRHWRNARTILSHNPVVYRARTVGDHAINGRNPNLGGAVGIANSILKEDTSV